MSKKDKLLCKVRREVRQFKRRYGMDKREKERFNAFLKVACNWEKATTKQKDAYYAYLMR